ncbi:uncharacterized protein nts [Cynoglossus semilaevis]|uniref:uncharacterized protein nts n=1 Tax=Cynoglossus semilaevis TaxID=244447 RepID=UPI0004951EFA|nr:uncharacterized protein LOC103398882 [Cynoglossus semilaevis]
MQAQLACVLLLFLTCCGLCADVDPEQRAIEEELFNSFLNSMTTQNKHNAPYRRVSLSNLCRMMSGLRQETWSGEEQEENLQLMEELSSLRHICRALQSREERLLPDSAEYLEENSDIPLKRKSPYILKRQAVHSTKSRRPYILKRNTLY